jgi:hypothetical protein
MNLEMTSGSSKGFISEIVQGLTNTWTNASFAVKDTLPYPTKYGDTFSIYVDKTRSFASGLSGKSINSDSLDGVNGKLSVPLNISNRSSFTVEVWFRKNNSKSWSGYLVDLGGLGITASNGEMSVSYSSWYNYLYPDGNRIYISSDPDYWQHFVVTSENGMLKMYLNGRYLGDATLTVSHDSLVRSVGVGRILGETDELVIYNRTLSESEVIGNFQSKYALIR